MSLHRLTHVTIGVPNVEEVKHYYREFGLSQCEDGSLASVYGGKQLRVVHAPLRSLLEVGIGVDDADDLARIERRLRALDIETSGDGELRAREPVTGVAATVSVTPRLDIEPGALTPYNQAGVVTRRGSRAPVLARTEPVRPRRLGHVVIGSVDQAATQRFFTDGLGFKVSDVVPGKAAFLRCSTDHHNLLVQLAPVNFLHHTSWEVDDVDEIGRGAMAMLEEHPERHVWGLGRHFIGSNFFWYLRDPAGNFSEYFSDMDCIVEDALWKPQDFEGARTLYTWGPPPPPSILEPEDLAALMTGAHSVD